MKKSLRLSLFLTAFALAMPAACFAQSWNFTPGPSTQNSGQPAGDGGAIYNSAAASGNQGYTTQDGRLYDQQWTQNNIPSTWNVPAPSNTTTNKTYNGAIMQNAIFGKNPGPGGPLMTSTQLLAPAVVDPSLSGFGGSNAGSYSAGFPNPGPLTVFGGASGIMRKGWAPQGFMSLPPVGTGTCTGVINITDQTGHFSPAAPGSPGGNLPVQQGKGPGGSLVGL